MNSIEQLGREVLRLAHYRDQYAYGMRYCYATGDRDMAAHYAEWVEEMEREIIATANELLDLLTLQAAAERAKTTPSGRAVVFSPFNPDRIALGHNCPMFGATARFAPAIA